MKNTNNLRQVLFDTIEDVRAGRIEPDKARKVVELSKQIIDSARLDLQATELISGLGEGSVKFMPLSGNTTPNIDEPIPEDDSPESTRKRIHLYHHNQMKPQDIAETLEIPVSEVRKTLGL